MSSAYHVPDPEFSGKNLRDMPAFFEVAAYGVAEWTPQDNGQGKAEAVILHFDMGGQFDGVTFGVRLKSKKEVQRLQTMLGQYAAMVWPKR